MNSYLVSHCQAKNAILTVRRLLGSTPLVLSYIHRKLLNEVAINANLLGMGSLDCCRLEASDHYCAVAGHWDLPTRGALCNVWCEFVGLKFEDVKHDIFTHHSLYGPVPECHLEKTSLGMLCSPCTVGFCKRSARHDSPIATVQFRSAKLFVASVAISQFQERVKI
jgi:hypothetical protein